MTPAELANLPDEAYGLLFDVRRSVRYHDKRAVFFERAHRVTNAFTILLAGSVMFDLARPGETPWWMLALALAGSLLAVADLVIGLAKMGNLHRDLQRRFADLERRMIVGPSQGECWTGYHEARLLIEMDEPTPYVMLDTICHNELLHVQGFASDDARRVKVTAWQRMTCQLWPWSGAFAVA